MSGQGAFQAAATHRQGGVFCGHCKQPWPCQTVCWERMQTVVDLHEPTEYRYEDDADVACTVCGVITSWPCPTVATLTGAKGEQEAGR